MTINEIVEQVSTPRPVHERKVRRTLHKLNIKPLGKFTQRPEQWPEDSVAKVREALGLPVIENGHAQGADDGKVLPLSKLKKMRPSARKAA